MKQTREIYFYRDGYLEKKYKSINDAVKELNQTASNISAILHGRSKITKEGYSFSFNKLEGEDLKELRRLAEIRRQQREKKNIVKEKNGCVKELKHLRLEIPCNNPKVFYIPPTTKRVKNTIMDLYMLELNQRDYPKTISVMKKEFMKELLDAL